MDPYIRRIVVDALKPTDVPLVDLSKALCKVRGTREVDILVTEVDAKTETVKITIRGPDIDYNEMVKVMEDYGTSMRSVDEINIYREKAKTKD